uniref:Putative tpa exp: secreted protein n=1 Tax=Amblyomma triste TaxID=251400 RepID=A0A023GA77_AMBTT
MRQSASCVSVSDVNTFVDAVIREKLPLFLKESSRLFPHATIVDFSFQLPKKTPTDRDLEVNMTHGEIHGFDTVLHREQDCESSTRPGAIIIFCNLTLRGLNITFTTLARDDTLGATWNTIGVHSTLQNTIAYFEASAPVGHNGNLRMFRVQEIQLDVDYGSELNLNEDQRQTFKDEVKRVVNGLLRDIFFNDYNDALRLAVESVAFPGV